MPLHNPTLFLAITTVSFVLAVAIAAVGARRKPALLIWSWALVLHSLTYVLLALRGEISDLLSIVLANMVGASAYAMITEGLLLFLERREPRLRLLIWSPVLVTGISMALLLNDLESRIIFSGSIFVLQILIPLYLLFKNQQAIAGRGHYLFITGVLINVCITSTRILLATRGYFAGMSVTTPNVFLTISFLSSLICVILFVIGLLLMTWEKDEQALKESENRMRILFENTHDAVVLLNHHELFDCNAASLKMFGYPDKQVLLGKRFIDLSPDAQACGTPSQNLINQHIQQAMAHSYHRFEWLYKRPNDSQVFTADVLLNAMQIHGQYVLQAVIRDITERKKLQQDLENKAQLDYLTGLYNRGHFMHLAEIELARAIRYRVPLSLMMIDIDHFKNINDTYGHHAGDMALKNLARLCQNTLREIDVVGRLGGEEFAVLLPETTMDQAVEVAERLRLATADTQTTIEPALTFNFTLSIGISSLTATTQSTTDLLNTADNALYTAKKSGRNVTICSAESAEATAIVPIASTQF